MSIESDMRAAQTSIHINSSSVGQI